MENQKHSKHWEMLMLLISSEEKNMVQSTDTEIETVKYLMNNTGVMSLLSNWTESLMTDVHHHPESSPRKNDELSLLWRQRGNNSFRQGSIEESYNFYCKSVMLANMEGPMYPLAVANRSATLFRWGLHKFCLEDIERAICHGYPDTQVHKLLLRRAECHILLGEKLQARLALASVKGRASNLDQASPYAREILKSIIVVERKYRMMRKASREEDTVALPQLHRSANPKFSAASSSIELRRSEDAGRHVVLTRATKRGDVMFSEEPYTFVALGGRDDAFCDGCGEVKINPVPCRECAICMYCTEQCRNQAYDLYHQYECPGQQAGLFGTIGIGHLAMRVLLRSAHDGYPGIADAPQPIKNAVDFFKFYKQLDSVQVYERKEPFYRMFHLITNFEKMNNGDYLQYAVTAVMLTYYLSTYTRFIDHLGGKFSYRVQPDELRVFAGALILRSLGQLVSNGHATVSLMPVQAAQQANVISEIEVRRATAIYPSAAMMNHSCDPNIVTSFYKTRMIVRCSRELSEGDELLNCYGPHCSRQPTAIRRLLLKQQYMFNCTCEACLDPSRGDFVMLFSAYTCQDCRGPVLKCGRRYQCQQCLADFNIERARSLLERADQMFTEAIIAVSLDRKWEKAQLSLRLKQQVYHRHNTALRDATNDMAMMFASAGDYARSMELMKHNLQSLEYQYGSFSVEVGHELKKLAELSMKRLSLSYESPEILDRVAESANIVRKAIQLLELNYGSWELLVKYLRECYNSLMTVQTDLHGERYGRPRTNSLENLYRLLYGFRCTLPRTFRIRNPTKIPPPPDLNIRIIKKETADQNQPQTSNASSPTSP